MVMNIVSTSCRRFFLALLVIGVSGVAAVQSPVVTALPDPDVTGAADNLQSAEGYFSNIVADPNGDFVLVRSASSTDVKSGQPSIFKIDTATGTRVGTIDVPVVPSAIAVSADGSIAVVGFPVGAELWLIDTATMTKTGAITSLPDGMVLGDTVLGNDGGINNWVPVNATMHGGNAFVALSELTGATGSRRTRVVRIDLDSDPNNGANFLSIVTVAEPLTNGLTVVAMAVNSTGNDLVTFAQTSTNNVGHLARFDLADPELGNNQKSAKNVSTRWSSCGPTLILRCIGDVLIVDDGAYGVGSVWEVYVVNSTTGIGVGNKLFVWNGNENGSVVEIPITSENNARQFSSLVRDESFLYIGSNINSGQITRYDLASGATSTQTFYGGQDVNDSRVASMSLVDGFIYAGTDGYPAKVMIIPTSGWPSSDAWAAKPDAVVGASDLRRAIHSEPSIDGDYLYVLLDSEPIVLQRVRTSDLKIDATVRLPDFSYLDNSHFSIAYDHEAGRAYVDLSFDPLKIAVIDLDTMTVVDTITDDNATFAGALAVRSTQGELLVLLDESGGTTVLGRFDLATGERLADIATTQNVGYADASALTLDADQSALFIAEANVVERIDLDSGTTTSDTITEAAFDGDAGDFVGAVAGPDGEHVYFLSEVGDYHVLIVKIDMGDVTDRSVVMLVEDYETADYGATEVAVSPDGSMLYLLTYDYSGDCECNNRVVVVDTATMTRIDSIDLTADDEDFDSIAISADGSTGFAIHGDQGYVASFSARTSWSSADIGGLDSLSNGQWSEATDVACNATGDCLVAGTYNDLNGKGQVFIARRHDGVWTDAEPIPSLIALNDGAEGTEPSVVDVDCDGDDICAIVGEYSSGYTDGDLAFARWLSFALVISTDPTSMLYDMDDATFLSYETQENVEIGVPNEARPVAVDCTAGAGTCAYVEMVELLDPVTVGGGVTSQDVLVGPMSHSLSAAGVANSLFWSDELDPTTRVSDLACNIAPTHCVGIGRYQPDPTNKPWVSEIVVIGWANDNGDAQDAPAVKALAAHDVIPEDLMLSCPAFTTAPANPAVSCGLAGSYLAVDGGNRTPFTADIALPNSSAGNLTMIYDVENSEAYGQSPYPDTPGALHCVTVASCVMAHDTPPDDPSQIWEFGSGTPTEYDTNDMPGYGPEFMSDWTFDPELFTSSSTSDLACATMDHCVVVGSFTNTDVTLPYIKTKHDGTWGYAERVPGVPYPNFAIEETDSASSYVNSVACPALDACVAIGGVRASGAGTSDARAIVVEQHAVTVIAPNAPRALDATNSRGAVTVTWEPPTAGMDSPVDYTVTLTGASSVMTCTATAPATQCVANGLAGGNYRVTATATNRFGTSWESAGTGVTVTTTTSPTVPTVPTVPATPPATPPAVTPVGAGRLYESRSGTNNKTFDGKQQNVGRTRAGKFATINVTGRAGVPDDATAVFLNVVAANPSGPGYLTVFACGTKQPLAANVNYNGNGNDISFNAVLAKIGTNGNVCIYTSADTDLIIDVNGYIPGN